MNKLVASAPAKINWTLDILSVDQRGYHILDMLMQRITLYDMVTISKRPDGIALSTSFPWLPVDERNTAFKSAKLFYEYAGIKPGCEIYVRKSIPAGAGLAGGSADAAATLMGLNRLYDSPLSEELLDEIALQIGADVPFMLRNGICRAGGIGQQLQPVKVNCAYPLLIVMNKRQPASTKHVYSLFDQLGSQKKPDTPGFLKALDLRDWDGMCACGGNVLTESAQQIAPDIGRNLCRLKEAGAKYAAMTGSGSAVFGVFESLEAATVAKQEFSDMWCFACTSFSGGIKIKELDG